MQGCTCQASSINHCLHCPFPWLLMLIPKMLILMMWCLCFYFLIFTLCFVIRHKTTSPSGNPSTPRSQWMTLVVSHHTGKCTVSYRMLIFSVYSGWQQYCVCGHVNECIHAYVYLFVFVFHNTLTKFQEHTVQVIWSKKSDIVLTPLSK